MMYGLYACYVYELRTHVRLTFETVDPILGGRLSKNDGELIIPKNGDGERFIPANWWKGWIGSNAALYDLPQSVRFHIAFNNAMLPKFTADSHRLKVRTGFCTYEAIPPKTCFKTEWSIPMRGCKLHTLEEWKQFIERIALHPLRGLGANPYALGGRIKLVEFKAI